MEAAKTKSQSKAKTGPKTPKPGKASRGSKSGRPVMALIELMGRRWVLRILWELRGEALTFRALQEACGKISPSVLNQRIADMRETGLVELSEDGYRLTNLGRELLAHLVPLTVWAETWAKALR
jgi:DNA-binding HxlR family transcriptional regulator